MDETHAAFLDWQKELDSEADFWGLRYIRPKDGGLIWRNAAACDFFEQYGFFPAATSPWAGARQWLGPVETARLEAIYAQAFRRFGHPITASVRATAAATVDVTTVFTALQGTIRHGLILTHYEIASICVPGKASAAQFA